MTRGIWSVAPLVGESCVPQRPTERARESLRPHIPDDRARAALDQLCRSSPTATTQPEMPAVRDPGPPSLSIPPVAFRDENTDHGVPARPVSLLRDRAVLLRLDGVDAGEVHVVPRRPLVLGRHPDSGLTISDRGLSRQHAELTYRGGEFLVRDLGSRNGTFRAGAPVHDVPEPIRDGDWIQLGPRVCFRFALVDGQQEQVLRQMYEGSKKDPLTGVANRRHFEECLEAEVSYARRNGEEVSLVFFDLDHFKQVNDSYGHTAGDRVLEHVAALVRERLRQEDILARYGGEEFVIILRGMDVGIAHKVGERLRATIAARPVFHDQQSIPVSISVGCASLACCVSKEPSELLERADRRLYLAKARGRNRVVSSD